MAYLVHQMLEESTKRFPGKQAFVFESISLTYEAAWKRSTQLASGLQALGVERRDRIGIFLQPSLELPLSIFAISQAGGAFVPMHHSLKSGQVKHIAEDCGMRGIITTHDQWELLRNDLESLPELKFVILTDGDSSAHETINVCGLQDLKSHETHLCDRNIDRDLAAILYTSGSTGRPKGVMLSHYNIVSGATIVSDYLDISDSDRLLAALPFSFDAGLNQLTTSVQQGATIVLSQFVFAKELVNLLVEHRITGLAGVPSLWCLLAAPSSGLERTDLVDLRFITNTGGALPLKVLDRLRSALPRTDVVLMYGLTEAFRSTYLPADQLDARPQSMGKAIPNTEILVVNDQGQLCQQGEIGELVHSGPTVSLGYWGQPEATRRVLRPHPFPQPGMGEIPTVCYSGDLVRMDDDGYLFFVGRRDNMIKSSGFRVSPTEVEEILRQSASLHEVAVIGIPHVILGQSIKAFVVPQESTLDVEDILANCARLAPRHMIPKFVEVVDALPKTSSGKVDYATLRERELHTTEVST
ncbi:MAG: acyl-CoA ligase (AMP-forming) (exosortase A-associated) [Pirellulaceae bacterium]|jgi:acyl-CoA ligase (AMP-forming) (exosortase A-associated)